MSLQKRDTVIILQTMDCDAKENRSLATSAFLIRKRDAVVTNGELRFKFKKETAHLHQERCFHPLHASYVFCEKQRLSLLHLLVSLTLRLFLDVQKTQTLNFYRTTWSPIYS